MRLQLIKLLETLVVVASLAATAEAQVGKMHAGLANKMRTLQTQIVSGRIASSPPNDGRGFNSAIRSGDRQERLLLSFDDNLVTMNYEQTSPDWQASVDVSGGNQISMRFMPKAEGGFVPVEFQQPDEGSLTLRVGVAGSAKEVVAPTVWHLLIAERELCERHLLPLMEFLRPDWKLAETVDSAEKSLSWAATTMRPYDRRLLAELVEELGSSRFARRQAAEKKLLDAGQAVLPILRGVERSRLDAEQDYRLRSIMRALQGDDVEDSPERVATWLAGDPYVWLALLSRNDESMRREAAKQLARLLQEPVVFDAVANEATRREQVKSIAEQIARVWAF